MVNVIYRNGVAIPPRKAGISSKSNNVGKRWLESIQNEYALQSRLEKQAFQVF